RRRRAPVRLLQRRGRRQEQWGLVFGFQLEMHHIPNTLHLDMIDHLITHLRIGFCRELFTFKRQLEREKEDCNNGNFYKTTSTGRLTSRPSPPYRFFYLDLCLLRSLLSVFILHTV